MLDMATEFIASLNKEADALKPKPDTPVSSADGVKKLSLVDSEGYETVTHRRSNDEKKEKDENDEKEEKEKKEKFYQRTFEPCRHITKEACEAADAKKVQENKWDRRPRCCLNAHADDLKPCNRENMRYGCGCRCVNKDCRAPKIRLCSYDTGNGKPVLLGPGQTAERATKCCPGVHVNEKKNPDMIRCGEDIVIATPKNIESAFALKTEESARRLAAAETRRINREEAEEKNPLSKKTVNRRSAEAATARKREKQKAANELRKKRDADALARAIEAAAPLKARCDAAPDTTILNRDEKEMLWAAGYGDIVKQCDENALALECRACGRWKEQKHGACRDCDPDEFQDEMGGGM